MSEPNLIGLPVELLNSISIFLPNRDIKSLRLTCRFFSFAVRLRLDRVFLSTNRLNIKVLRAVADHEVFRKQIVEIVWDDARLEGSHRPSERRSFDPEKWTDEICYEWSKSDCYKWFWCVCERNLQVVRHRKGDDVDRPDHVARDQLVAERLSLKDCWEYYEELLDQQSFSADIDAFRYGLARFPSLKRVTITPLAHGYLFTPLYETPMIRAFPRGFNYHIPRKWWINDSNMEFVPVAYRWDRLYEHAKDRWRGFRIVTQELARIQEHNVVELSLEVLTLLSGINCTIFTQPCDEYNDFVTVLQRPGFRRLNLALLVGKQGDISEPWSAFKSGLLRQALSMAPGMEHISLRTSQKQGDTDMLSDPDKHFVPLKTVFPIDKWPHLRHFALSQFIVRQYDVLTLLEALPTTLRSVELSCLIFIQGNYHGLLTDMRDTLDWRGRPAKKRPKVVIGIATFYESDQTIWVNNEVEEFLWREGVNPFNATSRRNHVPYGVGFKTDAFDPNYERPNLDSKGLADAGYIQHL